MKYGLRSKQETLRRLVVDFAAHNDIDVPPGPIAVPEQALHPEADHRARRRALRRIGIILPRPTENTWVEELQNLCGDWNLNRILLRIIDEAQV